VTDKERAETFNITMTALAAGTLNQIIDPIEARSNTVLQENVELEEFAEEETATEITETPEEQEEMIGGEDVEEEQEDGGERGDSVDRDAWVAALRGRLGPDVRAQALKALGDFGQDLQSQPLRAVADDEK
jgi:hypothetical protein